MKFTNKHNGNEDSFWLSATDMMAGILIVVLLLLMLFLLYLSNSGGEVFSPLDASENSGLGETQLQQDQSKIPDIQTETLNDSIRQYSETQPQNQGGQGEEKQTEPPTEPPYKNKGDNGFDEKAAVLVDVVDADSGNTIKKSGIAFELYSNNNGTNGLQTLSSYYQERTVYSKFETGESGTFYLPEKIAKGWYSLHNINAPDGYYLDENTEFEINEYYDWSQPYEVTVRMKPIKKTIRVLAEDADTADPMAKVKFKIIASEDITTADGEVRHRQGDVVGEITTDGEGFAESGELYIGKYHIKQETTPEYYAVDTKAVDASVSDNDDVDTGLVKIYCYKTSVTVRLLDERTEEPIEGAVYSMAGRDKLVTDKNGEFTISELKKNEVYEIDNESVPEGYIKKDKKTIFTVDVDGLVDEKATLTIADTAYTISLRVDVKDKLFGRTCKGVDLQLLDAAENVVDEWTINDQPYILTGLEAGTYYVQRSGIGGSRTAVNVKDTAELQTAEMLIWDTIDLFALLMAIGAVIIGGLVIIFVINRKKKVSR